MGYPIVLGRVLWYFLHDVPHGISIAKSTAAILFLDSCARPPSCCLDVSVVEHVAFEQRHKSEEHNEVDRTDSEPRVAAPLARASHEVLFSNVKLKRFSRPCQPAR